MAKKLRVALYGLVALVALISLPIGLSWLLIQVFQALLPLTPYATMSAPPVAVVLIWAIVTLVMVRRQRGQRRLQLVLTASAVLSALPFLLILGLHLPLRLLYRLTTSPGQILWLYWPVVLAQWLLSDMTRYLVVSLAALILSAAALMWLTLQKRRQALRYARLYGLVLALGAVLIFPFVMHYRPAVEAAAEVDLRVVDEPGLLAAAVKRCQAGAEVRTCVYEPMGWADTQILVYRTWCGGHYAEEGWEPGAPGTPLAYDVKTGETRPSLVEWVLSPTPCNPGVCVTPFLAEVTYFPPLRYLPGHFEAPIVSPDERWVAFTARHVYGPEDLLVISNGDL